MSNERFDEGRLGTLQQWTSQQNNDQEQLRNDAILEIVGELLGLRRNAALLSMAVLRWLLVESDSGMDVTVGAGLAVAYDTTAGWLSTGRSRFRPVYLPSDATLTVPTADPSDARIDIVLIKAGLYTADEVLVPFRSAPPAPSATRTRVVVRAGTYAEFLSGDAELCIKTGTPSGSPAEPTTDAGAIRIASISVGALAGSISASDITDERQHAAFGGRQEWHGTFNGSIGASFPGSNFGLTGSPVEIGGLRIYGAARTAQGRFAIQVEGFDTSSVSYIPIVQVTPVEHGASNRFASCEGVSMGGGVMQFTVRISDDGGTLQDTDFCLSVLAQFPVA